MRNPVLGWVQAHADGRDLVLPGGPLRFALRLTSLLVLVAMAATVAAHVCLDAVGLLPYPLGPALAVGLGVSFLVSGSVSVLALLGIGSAIQALAVNRDEFRRLSATDELSGLLNRRAFLAALAEQPDAALILLDIDHFKQINDRYGHGIGDEVIRGLSGRLRQDAAGVADRVRVGRLGGEEFAVLLPGLDLAQAASIAETLRRGIGDAAFATPAGPIAVTVSMGVATPNGRDEPGDFYRRCDAALYAAKRGGRDRVAQAGLAGGLEPLSACA